MWTLKLPWLSPRQDLSREKPVIYRTRFSPVTSMSSRIPRCAAASLLCLLTPIALASEHAAMGMKTNADGSASISIGAPHTFASVFLDGDIYNSDYNLEIAAGDRGQLASIFMAGTFNGDWHLKSASGWHAWDPDTEQLTPFAEAVLTEVVDIEAFTNSFLAAGDYVIYAAYQIAGQDLVVAANPLRPGSPTGRARLPRLGRPTGTMGSSSLYTCGHAFHACHPAGNDFHTWRRISLRRGQR